MKTNPNMCILMYFKIQSDQPKITQNALKSRIFDSFTKPSSGHIQQKLDFLKSLVLFLADHFEF